MNKTLLEIHDAILNSITVEDIFIFICTVLLIIGISTNIIGWVVECKYRKSLKNENLQK